MKKLRVYVAGNYSADNVMDVLKNIGIGIRESAKLLKLGYAPFCPWLDHHLALMDVDIPKQSFYDFSMAWLEVSDVIYVLPNSEKSKGTQKEIKRAIQLDIPVIYSLKELKKCDTQNKTE